MSFVILYVYDNGKKVVNSNYYVGAVPHPYLSYINKPGVHFKKNDDKALFNHQAGIFDYGFYENGLKINYFGDLINPDTEKFFENNNQKPYKILIVGGSTAGQPWSHLLEDRINKSKMNAMVINQGTGGYTSQENMIKLLISGFHYEPDLVIAYLPINDIYWAAHNKKFRRDYTHFRIPYTINVNSNKVLEPEYKLSQFPMTIRLYQFLNYKKEFENYEKSLSFTTLNVKNSISGELTMDEEIFKKTLNALWENTEIMSLVTKKRGKKFLLITQKVFKTNNDFYTFMDNYVEKANQFLIEKAKQNNILTLEAQKSYDTHFNSNYEKYLKSHYQNLQIDFKKPLAYDSMHFTPTGLALFSEMLFQFGKKSQLF